MIFILYSLALVGLSALPCAMVWKNLPLFQRKVSKQVGTSERHAVSVLIPARNEDQRIGAALDAVLATTWPDFEILVLDDHSTDRTAEIVSSKSLVDPRVKLVQSLPLPQEWNGKQFACWQLAQAASYDLLMFVDADVRLSPGAIAECVQQLGANNSALVSGFPRQVTEGAAEKLLIPMMYFVLLGYLPLWMMRQEPKPEFGAGCGQLFLARKKEYFDCGGHGAIKSSRHDGLKLPRAFRQSGFQTDLFDAQHVAEVRMYEGWQQVIAGVLKNATEGIASPRLIGLFSILLLGAAVLPIFSLLHAAYWGWPGLSMLLLLLATSFSFLPPVLIWRSLSQSPVRALWHPVAVLSFVLLQWVAFLRQILGLPAIAWRGRN